MAIDETAIEEAGQNPKRARTAEGSVEERPIDELVKADRYSRAKQVTGPPFGMTIARTQPQGGYNPRN